MNDITILLDRNSVCAGDSCDSHEKEITLDGNTSLSALLVMLAEYVPSMEEVVWMVESDTGLIGYIITDEQRHASVEVCGNDKTVGSCGIQSIKCIYCCNGHFTRIDRASGEKIEKYPECKTLLEKVKKTLM